MGRAVGHRPAGSTIGTTMDPNRECNKMIELERSLTIRRPVAEVFAFVTDVEKSPRWQAWAVDARVVSEGPLAVGTQYEYVARFLGRRIESRSEVTAYEPDKRYAWKVTSGPIPAEASLDFESVDGGTRVTLTGKGEPGGFFRLAEPVIGRMVKRQVEADIENLKDLLESRP